jgi:hypothetical protein
MIQKRLVFFTFIVALLSAFYYFYEIKWTEKKKETLDKSKKLFKFKAEDVEGLRIKNSKITLIFKKKQEDWFIIEPVRAKGNKADIETIINALVSERWMRELTLEEGKLADFGLAQPAILIAMKGKNLGRERTIQLGSKSPTGNFLYVRIDQEPRILMVHSWLKNIVNKSSNELTKSNLVSQREY